MSLVDINRERPLEEIKAEQKGKADQAETQRKRIADLLDQEKALPAQYEELEKGIYLCEQFTKAREVRRHDFRKAKGHHPLLDTCPGGHRCREFPEVQQIIQDGAIDYFGRFQPAAATIPSRTTGRRSTM